ncbi:hypothetical protein OAE79_02700 [Rhodopirellula sp.]|nr:hypothetical protein [Rhodopirellula sp.]MDB4679227.1 hypothetical protein [Rhodopirellula sp.]MDB4810081.1 hypothetical protein [bacterium]
MNPVSQPPRPLELRFPLWVALGVVALIGIQKWVRPNDSNGALAYLDGDRIFVNRQTESLHFFERLNVEVEVTSGWTYLSTNADSRAMTPTFMHTSSQTILRLQPFHLEQWPPEGASVQTIQDDNFEITWVPVGRLLIGRLVSDSVDLAVVVMNHSTEDAVSEEILEFCRCVQHIGTASNNRV